MKISIYTPTNDSSRLRQVYASIEDQDFYEWIILYNGGQNKIGFKDDRVKEIVLKEDSEQSHYIGYLKGTACSYATGNVLLELDHDDLLMPDAIEKVAKAFEDESVGFVYSNAILMTADFGKVPRYDERYGWRYREIEHKGHKLDEHLHFDPSPAMMSRITFAPNHLRAFRRSVYESVGGYNRGMRVLDDEDLMCRIYLAARTVHIDEGLYIYVVHGNNSWLKPEINAEIQSNVLRLHDQYIEPMALKWARESGLRCLDLGGRLFAKEGYETVDLRAADITADLNLTWPFKDGSVGVVRAYDVFEHLKSPIHTMMELHRILAPGGYAFIQVPSTDGRGAFQDPTHISWWNQNSFLYYTTKDKNRFINCPVRFQAMRLYTTEKNNEQVCWTLAHLLKIDPASRTPGEVCI
jgi:SAM-dependent methyltransferase